MADRPCRKIRYRTELDAKIALADTQMKALRKNKRTECRAYRCPDCHAFHLTSSR